MVARYSLTRYEPYSLGITSWKRSGFFGLTNRTIPPTDVEKADQEGVFAITDSLRHHKNFKAKPNLLKKLTDAKTQQQQAISHRTGAKINKTRLLEDIYGTATTPEAGTGGPNSGIVSPDTARPPAAKKSKKAKSKKSEKTATAPD